MTWTRGITVATFGFAVALGLTGCGDGGDTEKAAGPNEGCEVVDGRASTGAPTQTVGLAEWSVTPAPDQVPRGLVTVAATNNGSETHELVIVRAPVDQLKVVDGAVDESQLPAGALIGEIEGFAAGKTCTAAFQLAEPGVYSYFCNVVETEPDGTKESHFEKGMVRPVTVL